MPPPEVAGEVVGNAGEVGGNVSVVAPGSRAGALAFTGTQITVWMVAAAALLLLGVGLLVAARQRAKRARP
jgi:LPXTG-motif cell wall-anchored protein